MKCHLWIGDIMDKRMGGIGGLALERNGGTGGGVGKGWFLVSFFLYTNTSIESKVSNRPKCSIFACEMCGEPRCLGRSYDHSKTPGFSAWWFPHFTFKVLEVFRLAFLIKFLNYFLEFNPTVY